MINVLENCELPIVYIYKRIGINIEKNTITNNKIPINLLFHTSLFSSLLYSFFSEVYGNHINIYVV